MAPAQNPGRIPVRSQRQAMDWSLVLLSQGIETTVLAPTETEGWQLVVASREMERALKSLRQYRVENRGWPWRQELPGTVSHFDWGCLVWAGLLILFYGLSTQSAAVLQGGIMDSAKVSAGQWWRVFTAMMLHADLGHLAENLSLGIVLFGLAMGLYGTGTGLFAAYLAGAVGNLASLALNGKPFVGLGASGMVMGALGLLAAQSLRRENWHGSSRKYLLGGVAAGVMLFVLFGLSPGTDMAAHLGGFVAGLGLGAGLVFAPRGWAQSAKVNFVSIVLMVAVVTVNLVGRGEALRGNFLTTDGHR